MKNEKMRKMNDYQCIDNRLLMNLIFYKKFMKVYDRVKIDSKNNLNMLSKEVFTSFKISIKFSNCKKNAFAVQLLKVFRKKDKIN